MPPFKSLPDLQKELRNILTEDLAAALTALKDLLPESTDKHSMVLALQARLKDANKEKIRNTVSPDDYLRRVDTVRAECFDMIDALEEADFDPPAAEGAPDNAAEGARQGSVLYRVPGEMPLGKPSICTIRVAIDDDAILEDIVLDDDVKLRQRVEISDMMEAGLLDPAGDVFQIRGLSETEQLVRETGFTQWLFSVTPNMAGEHQLLVKVSMMEYVENLDRYVPKEVSILETVTIVTESQEVSDAELAGKPKSGDFKKALGLMVTTGPGAAASKRKKPPEPGTPAKSLRMGWGAAIGSLALVCAVVLGVMYYQNQSDPAVTDTPPVSDAQPVSDTPGVKEDTPAGVELAEAGPAPDTPFIEERQQETPVPADTPVVKVVSPGGITDPKPPKPPSIPVPPVPVPPDPPPAFRFDYPMVPIPGGVFVMGDEQGQDDECEHEVTVGRFEIGQYEVSQAQWRLIMGSLPRGNGSCPDCPVVNVSWNDVQAFIKKLNDKTGDNYRLPNEAEWEYAARAGTRQAYAGCNRDKLGEYARFISNSNGRTWPVGSRRPNAWKLYDMSGNVWEWCQNTYAAFPGCSKGASVPGDRVLRGGSWYSEDGCRVSYRLPYSPENSDDYTGFRLAR